MVVLRKARDKVTGPETSQAREQVGERGGIKRYLRPLSKDGANACLSGSQAREPLASNSSSGHLHPLLADGRLQRSPSDHPEPGSRKWGRREPRSHSA